WERKTGALPKTVDFYKLSTRVPDPWDEKTRKGGLGYDPWSLPVKRKQQERITCATIDSGRDSPEVRQRHGLPPVLSSEGAPRAGAQKTWVDDEKRFLDRSLSTLRRGFRDYPHPERGGASSARGGAGAPNPDQPTVGVPTQRPGQRQNAAPNA